MAAPELAEEVTGKLREVEDKLGEVEEALQGILEKRKPRQAGIYALPGWTTAKLIDERALLLNKSNILWEARVRPVGHSNFSTGLRKIRQVSNDDEEEEEEEEKPEEEEEEEEQEEEKPQEQQVEKVEQNGIGTRVMVTASGDTGTVEDVNRSWRTVRMDADDSARKYRNPELEELKEEPKPKRRRSTMKSFSELQVGIPVVILDDVKDPSYKGKHGRIMKVNRSGWRFVLIDGESENRTYRPSMLRRGTRDFQPGTLVTIHADDADFGKVGTVLNVAKNSGAWRQVRLSDTNEVRSIRTSQLDFAKKRPRDEEDKDDAEEEQLFVDEDTLVIARRTSSMMKKKKYTGMPPEFIKGAHVLIHGETPGVITERSNRGWLKVYVTEDDEVNNYRSRDLVLDTTQPQPQIEEAQPQADDNNNESNNGHNNTSNLENIDDDDDDDGLHIIESATPQEPSQGAPQAQEERPPPPPPPMAAVQQQADKLLNLL